ncbi:aspartate/glutamate racemase family protein [Actinomadura keratinilytica]|uniref:Asp/Glu racemase n=1 Tax=Actinomadura keratinilytica TaxID=547461 RepID=A0ABP7YQT8_9ACTN
MAAERTPATVAVVNAAAASMAPATRGLRDGFPEARIWHLLDDRLVTDADAAGGMTPELCRRMLALIDHAVRGGADAVLLSCSMYGPAAELARGLHPVPVMGSDEAMFGEVAARRPARAAVIGSLDSAVADSVRRLEAVLSRGAGPSGAAPTRLVGVTAAGAAGAAAAGDRDRLLESLTAAADAHAGSVDLFVLGQYSLTPVHAELAERLPVPVLSPPLMAAKALRRRLLDPAEAP